MRYINLRYLLTYLQPSTTPFTRHSSIILVWDSWLCSKLVYVMCYLSSHSFRVKCENCFSSSHTCLCGVPQGSVLGPVLFIMYTTALSTLFNPLRS